MFTYDFIIVIHKDRTMCALYSFFLPTLLARVREDNTIAILLPTSSKKKLKIKIAPKFSLRKIFNASLVYDSWLWRKFRKKIYGRQ